MAAQPGRRRLGHLRPGDRAFTLPAEHALLVAENSPSFLLGGFDIAAAVWADEDLLAEGFRTGHGIGCTNTTTACSPDQRFFRPGYRPTW